MSTQGQGDVAARPYAPGDAKIQIIGIIRLEDGEEYKGALLTFPAGPPDMKVLSAWDGTPFRIVPADEHDRLRTLLSSSRGEQGWRTIDSAPKDGTYIILGNAQGAWVGCYVARYQSGFVPEDPWHSMMMNRRHMPRYSSSEPTHWQPLPSAPGSVPTPPVTHASDCALHNAPAMEPGPCDCGAVPTSLAGQVPDIIPMGRENDGDKHVTAYMCLVDFECEIGLASGGNIVYPSIEECREGKKCVAGCGIVEVEIRATRVVQEPSDEGDVVVTGAEIEAQSPPQPTAVAGQGTDDWRCVACGCRSYARVDEQQPDGSFKPGNLIRCVECKFVSSPQPTAGGDADAK
jgi:hypothetical protein